jgi:hypothetical protein
VIGVMCNAETGDGAVAQLGERLVRNEEVRGSIPLSSTIARHRYSNTLQNLISASINYRTPRRACVSSRISDANLDSGASASTAPRSFATLGIP